MRTRSRVAAFGVDLLQDLPWTDVGTQVDNPEAYSDLSTECRCSGRLFVELGRIMRGYLLRFDDELHAALHENGSVAHGHAGAVYWTEDVDIPTTHDQVYLLTSDEIELIERNSLTMQLEKLRAGHTAETVAALDPGDPARGILSLLLEREAIWQSDEETADRAGASDAS